MMNFTRTHVLALLALIFSAFTWALWATLSRQGVTSGLNAFDIVFIRLLTSAIILLPVFWLRGRHLPLKQGLPLAFGSGFGYLLVAIHGFKYVPSMHGMLMVLGLTLMIAPLLSHYVFKQPSHRSQWLGIALISCALMVLAQSTPASASNVSFGHVLFVIAGIIWSVYTALVREWKINPWVAVSNMAVLSIIIYGPIYGLFLPHSILSASVETTAIQALVQGVLTAVIALYTFSFGLSVFGTTGSAVTTAMTPIFCALLSIPLMHEYPTTLDTFAMIIALIGIPLALGLVKNYYKNS